MDFDKKICPIVSVDGLVTSGKQFDIDIMIPEDNRNVIYGVIKDCYKEPICNAVVKLIEVDCKCGKEERKPVAHTFTNEDGEFVFGPLCPNKSYEVNIWVNKVKHVKICAKCKHEAECLKGIDIDCCDFTIESSNNCCHKCNKKSEHKDDCKCKCDCKHEYDSDYKSDCKKEYKYDCEYEHKYDYKHDCKSDYEHKDDCKKDYKPECKPEHKDDCKQDYKPECKPEHKDDCKQDYKPECKPEHKDDCKQDYKPSCKKDCYQEYRPNCKNFYR